MSDELSGCAKAYYDDLMAYPQWITGSVMLSAAQELSDKGYGKIEIKGCDFDPEPYVFFPANT